MAQAELIIAFGAKLDGLEASLKRVDTKFGQLETKVQQSSVSISRSMERTAESVDRLNLSLDGAVRGFVAFVALTGGISSFVRLLVAIDDISTSLNRLQTIAGTTKVATQDIFANLIRSAVATGQPINALVEQFGRFRVATRGLGASNADVQRFVGVLSQFAQLSGQKPQEAAAAITQLAQGLASGRLQGDELKSIMENMPQLAEALAKGLGISTGELRKMGQEGKLLAENVFPAILQAGNLLGERLKELPISLRQAWQSWADLTLVRLETIAQQLGVNRTLTDALSESSRQMMVRQQDATAGPGGPPTSNIESYGRQASALLKTIETTQARIDAFNRQGSFLQFARQADLQGLIADRRKQFEELRSLNILIANAQEQQNEINRAESATSAQTGRDIRVTEGAARARDIQESVTPLLKAVREREERINQLQNDIRDRFANAQNEADRAQARARVEAFRDLQMENIEALFNTEWEKQNQEAVRQANAVAEEIERAGREAETAAARNRRAIDSIIQAGDSGMAGFANQLAEWSRSVDGAKSAFDLFIEGVTQPEGILDIALLFRAITREAEKAGKAMIAAGRDPGPAILLATEQINNLRAAVVALGTPDVVVDIPASTELADLRKRLQDAQNRAGAGARSEAREVETKAKREERERLRRLRAEQSQRDQILNAGDEGLAGFAQRMREWTEATEETRGAFDLFLEGVAKGTENMEILFRAVTREGERAAQSLISNQKEPTEAIAATNAQLQILRDRLLAIPGSTKSVEEIDAEIAAATSRMAANVQKLGDKAELTFNQIKATAVRSFASDAAGAIVDFAATSEQKFSEVAANFAKNIAKMILQLLIFRALVAGLKFSNVDIPGITSLSMEPLARMAGGPVTAGEPYIVGEKRAELFVPGSSGYIYPSVNDNGSGGAMEINVYNQANGVGVRAAETQGPNGQRQIALFVEEIVKTGLSSGRFDAPLRTNFNLNRPGRV